MALGLLLLIGLGTLIVWLYRINKNYFVLSFFAPRVRTKDGRPLEDLVALAPGNSLFGNNFDLYGLNAGGFRSVTGEYDQFIIYIILQLRSFSIPVSVQRRWAAATWNTVWLWLYITSLMPITPK